MLVLCEGLFQRLESYRNKVQIQKKFGQQLFIRISNALQLSKGDKENKKEKALKPQTTRF